MKKFMTGNEAVARGAYEGGLVYASAYPGTPSTEILENISKYREDIIAEWAPNEKVALETAIGASVAGVRSLASMKHVGVNVAADPMFTYAYMGVNGGMVLVTADDPSMHSSQNEQDNRYYAKFAKIPMLEPSDSQECKDMMKQALEISEKYDVMVLFRMTTRVCHSKSLVELGQREGTEVKEYVRNNAKFDAVPAVCRALRIKVEERMKKLEEFSNKTDLNFFEWNNKEIGIIASGIGYQYAKEVFGDKASYLKLGFTYPLPMEKIEEFSEQVGTVYVVEELEPFIEEQVKAHGIPCIGKERIPNIGELNPGIVRKALLNEESETISYDEKKIIARPPTLCAGCPHRGFFYELGKLKNVMITGDIGCYGLGGADPLNAKDTCVCMGASISMAHAAQRVFDEFDKNMKTIATIGDSTFFHTGINSLIGSIYNNTNSIICILDNRVTAMTGHQDNPGTGLTLQGEVTEMLDIENIVRSLGCNNVRTINPNNLDEVKEALEWAMELEGVAIIITRWPCILKRFSDFDLEEFDLDISKYEIDPDECISCGFCIECGCPAIIFDSQMDVYSIDDEQCIGCSICAQICPTEAINLKEGDK